MVLPEFSLQGGERAQKKIPRGEYEGMGTKRSATSVNITASVPTGVPQAIVAMADRLFDGNRSIVVRDAIGVYLRLREVWGEDFDAEYDRVVNTEVR